MNQTLNLKTQVKKKKKKKTTMRNTTMRGVR